MSRTPARDPGGRLIARNVRKKVSPYARFTAFASDEDWLALMTALERTSDPAAACLRQMLLWSLRQDSHADCDADHECCNHRS